MTKASDLNAAPGGPAKDSHAEELDAAGLAGTGSDAGGCALEEENIADLLSQIENLSKICDLFDVKSNDLLTKIDDLIGELQ